MNLQPAAQNTRERILTFLRENKTATVPGLSRAWGLTRADIRYHMHALLKDGMIEIVAQRSASPAQQRGRPTQIYRLTSQFIPGNYLSLCSGLLKASLVDRTPEQQALALQNIALQIAGPVPQAASPTQRYNQAVQILNTMAYRARWEAAAAGPRFLLRSCPYAALLDHHPELCRLDLHLLEHLFQTPLAQVASMHGSEGTGPACVFMQRRTT